MYARRWFTWREPAAWAIAGVAFAFLFFGLTQTLREFPAFLIALAAAFCLFFFYLDRRTVGIRCPNAGCGKHVATNTPWVCAGTDTPHLNDQVDSFPFINRCQHCGFIPKAYQCPHCFQLIFLSADKPVTAYAKLATLPAKSGLIAVKRSERANEIVPLEKSADIAAPGVPPTEPEARLERYYELLESQAPQTQDEITAEYFAVSQDRNLAGAVFVERKKAENAEKYGNNPGELERQNALVDQWARDHLDLM